MNIIQIVIIVTIIWMIYCYNNKDSLENRDKINVAIIFYGLTRSLKRTINSIKNNILQPLNEDNRIDYDTYLHTWKFKDKYNNPWANESNIYLNFDEYKLLDPDFYQLDDQDLYDVQMNDIYNQVQKHGKHPHFDYITQLNILRAKGSLKRAFELLQMSNKKYDVILVLRPDLLYTTKLNTQQFYDLLHNNQENQIYIPKWASHGGYNDRIAFGTPSSMEIYKSVIDYYISDYNKYGAHTKNPESRLKKILDENHITVKDFELKGKRVRVDGRIAKRDINL